MVLACLGGYQNVNFVETGLETGMTQYQEMGLTRTQDFVLPVTTKAVRFLTVNGTPGLHVTTCYTVTERKREKESEREIERDREKETDKQRQIE